ncbi:hypothetical protein EAI_15364 [Harpegnathos saltator]|uniref:Uncharacterized protein n=2 Tax=Harpegnathos saltator TaxID=610380 RepID=E2BDG7_HARSA|nr:hypothetical protein EAI_15364 [Harpegnathos saltator]
MTQRSIKRIGSGIATVPSILAKKPKMDEVSKKAGSSDVTFDGFGGHAKYDKFPKSLQNQHAKKSQR